ncbi:hypothetical protein D0Z08_06090 [Nocardioides immobilis]|uniref:Preprotein translocase subunit SecD n=2 Tax=Nocardioides immobilis TaxID=2049295 RepID=A0A417Y5B4_9ACTN|nr:hypothetical protein D0Z08_06090 [Nocardioides immobilis]
MIVLAAVLALVVGCSSSDNDDPDAAASSSSPTESDGDEPSDPDPTGKQSGDVQFRPMIAARPADAGAPADTPKKLRRNFAATDCTEDPRPAKAKKTTVACGIGDTKYLLDPAVVVNSLTSAQAVEFRGEWVVAVIVSSEAQQAFETLAESADNPPLIAIEQGGTVLQVRGIAQLADKGRTSIDGDFDEREAAEIAELLGATIDS